MPAGMTIFHSGDQCQNYLFVIEGCVRVQKVAANGREIVLYRVNGGDTCILTTSCLLNGEGYSAEGVTESAVKAISLPASTFTNLLKSSQEFQIFVFGAFLTNYLASILVP
ncbi:MAG: cyclic nucleotide-binding domain-containing protein [Rhodospirillales bacterium]|nr:cyclic nucleotide-binding domain-containing protein [Rhodospirillales bacterium]